MASYRMIKSFVRVASVVVFLLLISTSSLPLTLAQWTGGHDVVGCKQASKLWYFAEGCTRSGFNEWLTIQNPNEVPVSATLTYMLNEGGNIVADIQLARKSRTTVNVGAAVPPGKDVSVKIDAQETIIAERPMYFNYGWKWNGGHNELGVTSPNSTWFFAEGYTGDGFDEYLCMQNPNNASAMVAITYFNNAGQNEVKQHSISPNSRYTVGVKGDCSFKGDVSVRVYSNQEIICERPMYFNYGGKWPGGHIISGANEPLQAWFFAEGTTRQEFDEYICILNPNPDPTTVEFTCMIQGGGPVTKGYAIGANSRFTVNPADIVGLDKDISVSLQSQRPVIAERPMYFLYSGYCAGGHCVLGADAGSTEWYFAEGYTGTGFDEYLCIQNPGAAAAKVTAIFMDSSGIIGNHEMNIVGNSRWTVGVSGVVGQGKEVSTAITSDQVIVVERPMYFNYTPQPPVVSTISPNSAQSGQAVSVTITGKSFQPGAAVSLTGNNYNVAGENANVVDGQTITCSFNLSNVPVAVYDVLVINPDGPSGLLSYAFNVFAPPAPPPPPPPPPTPGLIMLDHTWYIDSINYLHIVGEVQNTTSSNIQFGKIVGAIYNAAGGVIATSFTYTDLDILAPNEKSPFHMICESPPGFAGYNLQTEYDTTATSPNRSLTILSQSSHTDSIGYLHIVGEVRNDSGQTIQFCEIIGIMYNSAGKVVDTDFTYSDLDTLSPGQTSPFELLISSDRAPLVHHWNLYTQYNVL